MEGLYFHPCTPQNSKQQVLCFFCSLHCITVKFFQHHFQQFLFTFYFSKTAPELCVGDQRMRVQDFPGVQFQIPSALQSLEMQRGEKTFILQPRPLAKHASGLQSSLWITNPGEITSIPSRCAVQQVMQRLLMLGV